MDEAPPPADDTPKRKSRARRADGLPVGFELTDAGVFKLIPKEDGDGEERKVSRRFVCTGLKVLARSRNRDREAWGLLVELTDADGHVHRHTIPASLFAGDATPILADLLNLGLRLGRDKAAKADVIAYLLQSEPTARVLSVSAMGWNDATCTAFVRGGGDVLGAEGVVYQSEIAASAAAEMRAQGTLEDWKREVSALCTGNPLLILAVSAGFAAPLLEAVGASSFGLHFCGSSSCGKTTGLRVGASVWASAKGVRTWRSTSNGLEGIAAAHNSTLLCLDELGEANALEAAASVYMLGNEQGKARALRDGRARPPQRWRLVFLSSGEISLGDKVGEAGKRTTAGQAVRLIELRADDRKHGAFDDLHDKADGRALSDALRAASEAHFGTAGPAFVAQMIGAGRDAVAASVRTLTDTFVEKATKAHGLATADGQVKRVLERFAVLAAAGELATMFSLTAWKEGAAEAAALDAFGGWLGARGGGKSAEAMEAVARLRDFLLTYGVSRFEPLPGMVVERDATGGVVAYDFNSADPHGPDGPAKVSAARTVIDRAGWLDAQHFYIHPTGWKKIHTGADPTRAAVHVESAGFLVCGGERDRPHVRRLDEVQGRPRVYVVKRSILGADEAGTVDDGGAQ
ncbi:MAG: DUF927 domain-containing protein [Alphaproteobacteria bacterium]|nr:DUF927 domain-containing protein [Alphaproteobacteria bacterium]